MSIFRCNKCSYIKEVPEQHIDKIAKCPKCGSENRVVDTVDFAQKVIAAYTEKRNETATHKKTIDMLKENMSKAKEYINTQEESHKSQIVNLNETIDKLQKQLSKLNGKHSQSGSEIKNHKNQEKNYKNQIATLKNQITVLREELENSTSTIDNISNTEEFVPQEDFFPIVDWFARKNIEVSIDQDAMDTKGFFDEVAIELGNNFHILESVLEQMQYVERKGYDTVKIALDKKSGEEVITIKNFCQKIYDYSFASKFYHDRKKNAIYIELQKATKIVNFFNGIWMEWYVYMMLLELFKKRDIPHTLVKGLHISYKNGEKNELDIFFIAHNTPVCIECKSGEFRKDIDKYHKLQKRLKLKKEHFVMCVIGLDDTQTDGLTNTYDMTFSNQKSLSNYIERLLTDAKREIDSPKKSGFLGGLMPSFKK